MVCPANTALLASRVVLAPNHCDPDQPIRRRRPSTRTTRPACSHLRLAPIRALGEVSTTSVSPTTRPGTILRRSDQLRKATWADAHPRQVLSIRPTFSMVYLRQAVTVRCLRLNSRQTTNLCRPSWDGTRQAMPATTNLFRPCLYQIRQATHTVWPHLLQRGPGARRRLV